MKITAVMLALAVAAVSVTACNSEKEKESLYFGTADKRGLAEETVTLEKQSAVDDEARAVLQRLLSGPGIGEHTRVIPEGTELISLELKDRTATVNLSQEFEKTGDNASRLLALYSVVATLCSIEGINKVQLLVNGRTMKYASTGEDIGLLSMNGVITDDEIKRNQTAVIELYFGSSDNTGLVKEQRMVDIKDNETIEKTVINELLKGPNNEAQRLLPTDVKLLSVETKDKLCYVNLSKEFLNISEQKAYLAVYSVVNTLTGQWQSNGVQFLVEGERTAGLGKVSLAEPLRFDGAIVVKE